MLAFRKSPRRHLISQDDNSKNVIRDHLQTFGTAERKFEDTTIDSHLHFDNLFFDQPKFIDEPIEAIETLRNFGQPQSQIESALDSKQMDPSFFEDYNRNVNHVLRAQTLTVDEICKLEKHSEPIRIKLLRDKNLTTN